MKISRRAVLVASLAAEGATGAVVLVAPDLVASLLFATELSGAGAAFARLVGIALLPLVIACWPRAEVSAGWPQPVRAVLVYNVLAAALLAWIGAGHSMAGVLLWPAVAEHALVALLLCLGTG